MPTQHHPEGQFIDPDPCPVCNKHLSSLITRRVGDIAVCSDCGDKLIPLMNAIAENICMRAADDVSEGMTLSKSIREMLAYLTVSSSQIPTIEASLDAR